MYNGFKSVFFLEKKRDINGQFKNLFFFAFFTPEVSK